MRIVAIADPHGRHKKIKLPEGDVLVVAGDLTPAGEITMLQSFAKWCNKQDFKHVICVAGNHDWCFANENRDIAIKTLVDNGIIYLEDTGVFIDGYKFYGSPWQPEFYRWAFNLPRGIKLKQKWELIPDNCDVLITHGPPSGFLDKVAGENESLGCEDLGREIIQRVHPKINIFGHIHSGHGISNLHYKDIGGSYNTTFINASVLDENYIVAYEPIVVEI